MQKPELLLPVGNVESFYAAIKGGADAIFLGLKSFNARGRAANFTQTQIQQIVTEAHKNKVAVYITLNTVVKNVELPELLNTLHFLSQVEVDAVIIQDWGTYFLLKTYFPSMVIHASTQMGNHNSAGTQYCKNLDFKRVILARELTFDELKAIQQRPVIETEIFVHGALCYSFSGMCHFSSYVGGSGANRGMCTQPCRRIYNTVNNQEPIFNLKDNQLLDYIPKLSALGINSLKIEGRLKSAEYVYNVAQAYRNAIDGKPTIGNSKNSFILDLGREKTSWFFGKQVKHALSETPNTGQLIGKIVQVKHKEFTFTSTQKIEKGNRLRIKTNANSEQTPLLIDQFIQQNNLVTVKSTIEGIKKGNEVYLAGLQQLKFPSSLKSYKPEQPLKKISNAERDKILNGLREFSVPNHQVKIYIRINNLEWLNIIQLDFTVGLIIQLKKSDYLLVDKLIAIPEKQRYKIWFELPQFIPEKDIEFYRQQLKELAHLGFNRYSLSHLSQKLLLPEGTIFGANENVYSYNDASSRFIYSQGSQWIINPFENDMDNLLMGGNRNQIIAVYFYPRLFYSRQPVLLKNESNFTDLQNTYRKTVVNGITTVLPINPVALTQYINPLKEKGYCNFLIDLSFEAPQKNTIKKIMLKIKNSEQVHPSTTFNFKKGLK